jgi:cytochrome c553
LSKQRFWQVLSRRAWLVLLGAGALAACAAALPHATVADATRAAERWPGTRQEDLEAGRATYVRRCAGCHTLYAPKTFSAERWPTLVHKMVVEKKLPPEEEDSIARFLVTMASRPPQASDQ